MVNSLYEGLLWDRQCFYNGLACKKKNCFGHPCNRSAIDQSSSVNMAECWPRVFFSSSSLLVLFFVLFCFLLCFFFFFFSFLWNEKRFEVHKNAVKELVQHPVISMSVENQRK